MIRDHAPQGSPEWAKVRLGIPTASCFDRLLSPTGKSSTQATGYLHQLIAERLSGQPGPSVSTSWMQRGQELEEEARSWYEFERGVQVERVGLCLRDDGKVGASPDGLIGEWVLEIKCPAPATHVKYLLAGGLPSEYIPQVQGELYVTGRPWADFVSYCPGLPGLIVRVAADVSYQVKLHAAIEGFLAELEKGMERLR